MYYPVLVTRPKHLNLFLNDRRITDLVLTYARDNVHIFQEYLKKAWHLDNEEL